VCIFLVVKLFFAIVKDVVGNKQKLEEKIMKKLDVLAAILVVVGALNWGLVAIARFDLVATIFGMRFGEVSTLSRIVYGLVAVAGVYQGLGWKAIQHRWNGEPVLERSR
jgi:uncharacterized membrane protein YuzA (DUF378 family)